VGVKHHSINQLNTRTIPTDLKTANFVPFNKQVPKYQSGNYRPISLVYDCCTLVSVVLWHMQIHMTQGPSWPWSYGSWIYNYLYICNQCLSPVMLWVLISIRARCTALCDKVSVTCDRSVVFSGFLHQ